MDKIAVYEELKRKLENLRFKLPYEKILWIFIIVVIMGGIIVWFSNNSLFPTSQDFGPIDTSIFGGQVPWVFASVSCKSNESYISEVSDMSCKVLVKPKEKNIANPIEMEVKIRPETSNESLWSCTVRFPEVNAKTESYCKDSNGNIYFELPKGDYRIYMNNFTSTQPSLKVTLTRAHEAMFRGTLHVMSYYEKINKETEKGTAIATFFAFIGIIPTALLEFRRFLREDKK